MSIPKAETSPVTLPTSTDPLGRSFEWLRLLGEGGFGEVYLARMHSAGLVQHVAVKMLHQGLDPRTKAVERLRDEAKLLASLRHPVVLAAIDLVELNGRVALITEFIEGQDLHECIDPEDPGRMPPSTLLEVIEQVASALDRAYSQLQVVHRDIKPANIRIGLHGNVKLLDFGIARSTMEGRSAKTETGMLAGTLRYLAPERFDTEREPTPAADLYALGCVLYDGVAGQPFTGRLGLPDLIRLSDSPLHWTRLVEQRLERISATDSLSSGLRELLGELLAYRPEARPTASEVVRRCENLTTGGAGHLRLARWCRDRKWPESPLLSNAPIASPVVPALPPPTPVLPPTGSTSAAELPRPNVPLPLEGPTRRMGWAGWAAALVATGGVTTAALGGGALLVVLALVLLLREIDRPVPTPNPAVAEPAPAPAEPRARAPVPTEPVPQAEARQTPEREGGGERTCDPAVLGPVADKGSLGQADRDCLRKVMLDTGQQRDGQIDTGRQNKRKQAGLVLLRDSLVRCEKNLAQCRDYETYQREFFQEVDQSDPDILYRWALHLHEHDCGDPNEAMLWANKALFEKQRWGPEVYSMRVDALYELLALEVKEAWEENRASPLEVRNAARDWLEYSRAAAKWESHAEALSLCKKAYGEEWCNEIAHTEEKLGVKFTSNPPGAGVYIDDKRLCETLNGVENCYTPFRSAVAVEKGIHALQMRFEGVNLDGKLEVSEEAEQKGSGSLWWECDQKLGKCSQLGL